MSFDPIIEIKSIAEYIEGKTPFELEDYFDEKVNYLKQNGIHSLIHVNETNWNRKKAAEWLLGQFIGIVEKAKNNVSVYNTFGTWLKHVNHFVIENKAGLED